MNAGAPFRGKHAIEIGSRVPSDGIMWRLQADHGRKHETGDEMVIRGLDTKWPITEAFLTVGLKVGPEIDPEVGMPKLLLALVVAAMVLVSPAGPGSWAQSQASQPTTASSRAPSWLTIGLMVGGAFLGRYLAKRYLSDWRIVQLMAGRAGAGFGAEAAGLAVAL